MTMLPPPPPSEDELRSRRAWWWIGITLLLVAVSMVMLIRFDSRRDRRIRQWREEIKAVNNARQIGLALFEFETAYGKFPDTSTIAQVRNNTGSLLTFGTKTSNDLFRQLIAAGIAQDERMFYAEIPGCHRPDNVFDTTHALEKGECAFTYFMGATTNGAYNPGRPLVVIPMIPGTDRFDPKPFKGKAVVLKADNSVTSLPIDEIGHILIDGRNLMDPTNPIWEGRPPVIAWPDL